MNSLFISYVVFGIACGALGYILGRHDQSLNIRRIVREEMLNARD